MTSLSPLKATFQLLNSFEQVTRSCHLLLSIFVCGVPCHHTSKVTFGDVKAFLLSPYEAVSELKSLFCRRPQLWVEFAVLPSFSEPLICLCPDLLCRVWHSRVIRGLDTGTYGVP